MSSAGAHAAATDSAGAFDFTLPPATYTLIIRAPGYEELRRADVRVTAGATVTLDLGLVSEAITLNPLVVSVSRRAEKALDAPAEIVVSAPATVTVPERGYGEVLRAKRAAGQVIDVAPSVVERAQCDAEHVGSLDAETPARITTDIPPSVRRLVHRRDHGRCAVPGCRHARFLDIHHIVPRAAGGGHEPGNLMLLCDAHHRAVHEGRLRITGTAPDALRFEHSDGRVYGCDVETARASVAVGAGAAAGASAAAESAPWIEAEKALRQLRFPAAVAAAAVARAKSRATSPGGHHEGLGASPRGHRASLGEPSWRPLDPAEAIRAALRECPRPVV